MSLIKTLKPHATIVYLALSELPSYLSVEDAMCEIRNGNIGYLEKILNEANSGAAYYIAHDEVPSASGYVDEYGYEFYKDGSLSKYTREDIPHWIHQYRDERIFCLRDLRWLLAIHEKVKCGMTMERAEANLRKVLDDEHHRAYLQLRSFKTSANLSIQFWHYMNVYFGNLTEESEHIDLFRAKFKTWSDTYFGTLPLAFANFEYLYSFGYSSEEQ